MDSIVKELCKFKENRKNKTFFLISKKLLDLFNQGEFISQKQLQQICHVSGALITQFAKKLNLSGYRELVIRLKIEYGDQIKNSLQSISENDETMSDMLIIHKFINENKKVIQDITKAILDNKKVAFVTCGQANDACRVFVDSVKIKGFLNISLINPYASGRFSIFNEPLFKYDKYFFIFTGVINPVEKEFYEDCLKKVNSEKVYSLITKGKSMNVINNNNISLDLDVKYSDTIYRNIMFNLLFLEIINIINKTLITL